MSRIPWQSSTLYSRLIAQREHGLSVGALQPIKTEVAYLPAGNIQFVVRILANLSRKEKALKQQGLTAPANPFLPYEEDLYVTDISKTHLCLLNKFNVVDLHFLLVTREFEPQESWLTLPDFEALVRCLGEVDGLAFFNGGTVAGASQPHKHLQVVPYSEELVAFPMEAAIAQTVQSSHTSPKDTSTKNTALKSPLLNFQHAIIGLETLFASDYSEQETAQQYLASYHQLLTAIGIISTEQWKDKQTGAYNFLCTKKWMMVVPRSQEKYADISINALGFVGSLFVKDTERLAKLKSVGPMEVLRQVSGFTG